MEGPSPETVVGQVAALMERKRFAQARALLRPALASEPNHARLLLQSAWIDYLDDCEDEAMHTVRQVLTSEPDNESARLLYFHLLMHEERHVEAEQTIIGLLREFPEHASYYGQYADLMLRTLNLQKAHQLAVEGLKYESDDASCLAVLTICDFIAGRSAGPALQQLLVRHPESTQTLVLVVVALQTRGQTREAKRVAQELVRSHPDNEGLVDMARQLNIATHWSLLPLWPLQRWGWGASFAIWILFLIGSRALSSMDPVLGGTFTVLGLIYVVYSWVWPPLLRRLLK